MPASPQRSAPVADKPATTDQLRHAIDSGRTGDKVRVSDPAAAPLGTDEEAAGATPSAASVSLAEAAETDAGMIAPPTPGARGYLAVVLIALAALAIVAWLLVAVLT